MKKNGEAFLKWAALFVHSKCGLNGSWGYIYMLLLFVIVETEIICHEPGMCCAKT